MLTNMYKVTAPVAAVLRHAALAQQQQAPPHGLSEALLHILQHADTRRQACWFACHGYKLLQPQALRAAASRLQH
jgi:hypothetical protein